MSEKKPRTPAQVAAFQKMLAIREEALRKKIREEMEPPAIAAAEEEAPPVEEAMVVAPVVAAPAEEQGYETVEFNEDLFFDELAQQKSMVDEMKSHVTELREELMVLRQGHSELNDSFTQHNVQKLHSLRFV